MGTYMEATERANEPRLTCRGCGHEETVRCPLPVDQMIDIVNGFNRRHAQCRGEEDPLNLQTVMLARKKRPRLSE